jgi:N-acetylneuraminic acid mutarotase
MSGPWVSRPPLGTARFGLETVDADGVIYAIGGFGTQHQPIHSSVEVRDPVSEQWSFVTPMSIPRANPGAAYLDGRIYVVGGVTNPNHDSNKGESFDTRDPSAKAWTKIKNRPGGPISGVGAAAFNGQVYIVGGEEHSGHGPGASITNAVSVFDPIAEKWSDRKPMPTARVSVRAVELDGQIYAVGGAVANGQPFSAALERYDPVANTWTKLRPMSVGRGNPGVVATADGRIIAVGGAAGTFGAPTFTPTVEAYDPHTNLWTALEPDLPVARAALGAERGQGGTILAIGGAEAGLVASTSVLSRVA